MAETTTQHSKWWNFAHVVAGLAPIGAAIFAISSGDPMNALKAQQIASIVAAALNGLTPPSTNSGVN